MTLLIWQFANASLVMPSEITWQRPHESLRKPATGRSWPVWWNSRGPPRLCTSGVSMIFHWQKNMATLPRKGWVLLALASLEASPELSRDRANQAVSNQLPLGGWLEALKYGATIPSTP